VNEPAGINNEQRLVFETRRLQVYVARPDDVELFYCLWTDPRVMRNVGFPQGLPITKEEIVEQLQGQVGRVFDVRLVVQRRYSGISIGECKLGNPNKEGLSTTDVKLLPAYWGNKYGVEIKKALVDYLFTYTTCTVVEATPNVENIASIKMQEAVGGIRVGEATFPVSESKRGYATPVHHYIYRVYRENWNLG